MANLSGQSVLVTGAAGCIGAWCVKLLTDNGAKPVVYDLTQDRSRLHLIMDAAEQVPWEAGDITDCDRLNRVIKKHDISAIIHLAALQVPFCKADPVGSTRVNVIGSINILEAARKADIRRLTYASSVAAPAMDNNDYLATLYGAHKICGEQMAAVYWQDWEVPSIGIRPGIIYGPGRDQGMSAAPSIAMLAALEGKAYTIPFSGQLTFCHVEDAASRFIGAISEEHSGAPVFDMNGTPSDTANIAGMINQMTDGNISYEGTAMPFPADADDSSLDKLISVPPYRTLQDGIAYTLDCFRDAKTRGIDLNNYLDRLLGVT